MVPEIQKARLTSVLLQLKVLSVEDPLGFDFMDKPPMGSLLRFILGPWEKRKAVHMAQHISILSMMSQSLFCASMGGL